MNKKNEITLSVPAVQCFIPIAVVAADKFAESLGFGEDAKRISLAMEECMRHALEFGYGGQEDSIQVSIAATALGIRVQTRFHGLPLKMENLPMYDTTRALENEDTAGINSFLIEKMMDKSAFSAQPGGMRMVSMEKNLPAELGKKKSSRRSSTRRRGQTPYDVRTAVPEDAESISRLALLAHGAVLFSEHIYYPKHVRNMLQAGNMVSVVAQITGENQLVAHLALIKHDSGAKVEELTYAIVDSRFRCKNCAGNMNQVIEADARNRGVYAIMVYTVTNHPHSQRGVYAHGYRECGLFVDASPASHSWGKSESGEMRIGNMTFVKYLGEFAGKTFYAPKHHQDMLKKIYSGLNVPVQFVQKDCVPEPGSETEIWTLSDNNEGWTIVGITRYGADALVRIAEILKQTISPEMFSIQLFLPLDDPMTGTLAGKFEYLGFFFAGVGPAEDGREGLQLQYVNTEQTDYDSIHAFSEFARELKAYVRKHDPRIKEE